MLVVAWESLDVVHLILLSILQHHQPELPSSYMYTGPVTTTSPAAVMATLRSAKGPNPLLPTQNPAGNPYAVSGCPVTLAEHSQPSHCFFCHTAESPSTLDISAGVPA